MTTPNTDPTFDAITALIDAIDAISPLVQNLRALVGDDAEANEVLDQVETLIVRDARGDLSEATREGVFSA